MSWDERNCIIEQKKANQCLEQLWKVKKQLKYLLLFELKLPGWPSESTKHNPWIIMESG
jgi:hypothetical protein